MTLAQGSIQSAEAAEWTGGGPDGQAPPTPASTSRGASHATAKKGQLDLEGQGGTDPSVIKRGHFLVLLIDCDQH